MYTIAICEELTRKMSTLDTLRYKYSTSLIIQSGQHMMHLSKAKRGKLLQSGVDNLVVNVIQIVSRDKNPCFTICKTNIFLEYLTNLIILYLTQISKCVIIYE